MIKVIDKNVMPKSFGNKGIKEVYKGDSLLWEIKEKNYSKTSREWI